MATVRFENWKKQISVPGGTLLLDAARQAGIPMDAPCGGGGKCGKCRAVVNGQEVLACQYRVESDIPVWLPEKEAVQILQGGSGKQVSLAPVKEGYLAAFDIGTTTIVCYLLAPEGTELAAKSMLNPQTAYGADVMTRIQQAIEGQLDALTRLVREGMVQLLSECCQEAGILEKEIAVISVVGNPCMQQLFLGLPVKNLAEVPFAPVLKKAEIVDAKPYFPKCENTSLLIVPDLSGYIGADTLACVLAADMENAQDTVLLVDIGTNGEMVLCHNGKMVACSTSAGPALEGASIQFGMRSAQGAIDKVWLEDGCILCHVIGQGKATGVCGSGLIDAVAAVLDAGLLNKRGRIAEVDGQRIIPLTDGIYLTQEDIRQVQLAKGAIAAGIHLMCEQLGITPKQVDRVILAGAFGSCLNPNSACRIGLLPEALQGRITSAGNLAGAGAKLMAMNHNEFERTEALVNRMLHLELSAEPSFQRTFAKCTGFRENAKSEII